MVFSFVLLFTILTIAWHEECRMKDVARTGHSRFIYLLLFFQKELNPMSIELQQQKMRSVD